MKIMVYDGPRQLRVEEAASQPLQSDQIRVKTMFSGISHGTEMNVYRGVAPFFRRKSDPAVRLFVDAEQSETWQYPIRSSDPGVWYMGYANVGRVIEAGSDVKDFEVGDIVYTDAPHQSEYVKRADGGIVKLPPGVKPEHGIMLTNLMTTYNGILDTKIKLGDTVVISGLGLIGQLLLQMVKLSGAFKVIGIDTVEKRLNTALENGADLVFNPMQCGDVAMAIRKETGNKGADAVIEATGNHRALHEAIRIAAPDTVITAMGWYQGPAADLDFSEEFHHNRVTIRSSQTGDINPDIRHMWNHDRKRQACIDLLSKLQLDNLITHRIAYDQVADAYAMVDNKHPDLIQSLLVYE
ncbi:zinc-dependent alcohol dehydrogenase [Paenibacillus gansuensis]|uniref:Zinc-binding alcohol dehydrogenase n=1 Tax=Paenibacillus gansuensis TaxID=306542 RepID=A0ABW5P810_9BACL